jgi:hypothetical protein
MSRDVPKALADVAQAAYLHEARRIADLLAEEGALRAGLARLDDQAAAARDDLAGDTALQAVGAGLLWRGWEDRTRRHLTGQLAQVLARKHAVLDQVRLAHGRQEAIRALQQTAATERRAQSANRRQAQLLAPWLQGD